MLDDGDGASLSRPILARVQSVGGAKTIGTLGSLVLMINNIMGPGMVALPFVFQSSGWAPATFALGVCGVEGVLREQVEQNEARVAARHPALPAANHYGPAPPQAPPPANHYGPAPGKRPRPPSPPGLEQRPTRRHLVAAAPAPSEASSSDGF